MKVYLALEAHKHEGMGILGVHVTREGARERIEKRAKQFEQTWANDSTRRMDYSDPDDIKWIVAHEERSCFYVREREVEA